MIKTYHFILCFVLLNSCEQTNTRDSNRPPFQPHDTTKTSTNSTVKNVDRITPNVPFTIEEDSITERERLFFKRFEQYEEIIPSRRVRRYYQTESGMKRCLLNEFIYEENDGFINKEYLTYELTFSSIDNSDNNNIWVNYYAYIGQASNTYGTIRYHNGQTIINTYGCGTTNCITTISVNDEIVYEKVEEIN